MNEIRVGRSGVRFEEYEQAVARCFRRNLFAMVLFEFLWGLGVPFAISGVLIPAYLNSLAADKVLIGIASAIYLITMPLQLFSERLFGRSHRCRNVALLHVFAGSVYVVYGLAGPVLPAAPAFFRIAGFILTATLFLAALNVVGPVYYAIVTDNSPVRWRGRLLGFRLMGLGIGGLLTSLPAQWVHRIWPEPACYHVAMIIAGSCFISSTLGVMLVRDNVEPRRLSVYSRPPHISAISEFLLLLRKLWLTPNYRVFIFFMMMFAGSLSLAPFIVTYARDILRVSAAENQLFNLSFLVSISVLAYFIGAIADRWGCRLAGVLFGVLGVATYVVAEMSAGVWSILLAYGLFSCIQCTLPTILSNMSVEMMPRTNPARLMVAGNVFCMPIAIILPVVCGRIIDVFSDGQIGSAYLAVFTIGIALAVVGGLGMALLVQEPRSGRIYEIKTVSHG